MSQPEPEGAAGSPRMAGPASDIPAPSPRPRTPVRASGRLALKRQARQHLSRGAIAAQRHAHAAQPPARAHQQQPQAKKQHLEQQQPGHDRQCCSSQGWRAAVEACVARPAPEALAFDLASVAAEHAPAPAPAPAAAACAASTASSKQEELAAAPGLPAPAADPKAAPAARASKQRDDAEAGLWAVLPEEVSSDWCRARAGVLHTCDQAPH